jgi:hypothetical protein
MDVEVKNPISETNADLVAVLAPLLLISLPIRAPKKGPIIMPPGIGAINPINNPIEVPTIL